MNQRLLAWLKPDEVEVVIRMADEAEVDKMWSFVERKKAGARYRHRVVHQSIRIWIKALNREAQTETLSPGLCVHSLRVTAATNALSNNADIAKVQEWLGHVDISTTWICDKRQSRPEDSLAFKVRY